MAGKKKSKYGIGNIVSWGATIVIIGLLFKIQHYPGSEIFICVGLGTEAFLFLLIGFQQEPQDPDWTLVYPELRADYVVPTAAAQPKVVPGTAASLDKLMADAKIGPELIGSLGEGLKTFGDKVKTISNVADASSATQEFTAKIKATSASYDTLNTAFTKASAGLADFATSSADTKTYHDQVGNLAKNLSALNAVYELELQDSSAHLKSMNKFYQNLGATMQGFTESVDDSKKFKDEVGRLAKNIASLNAVYGNMLSAMSGPKA